VVTSIAAWINTKIILEEIDTIKKHLGIPENKPIDIFSNNYSHDDNDKKQE